MSFVRQPRVFKQSVKVKTSIPTVRLSGQLPTSFRPKKLRLESKNFSLVKEQSRRQNYTLVKMVASDYLTPFMAFAKLNRAKIIAANPGSAKDVTIQGRKLGEAWQKLTDAEKKKYANRIKKAAKGSKKASKGKKAASKKRSASPKRKSGSAKRKSASSKRKSSSVKRRRSATPGKKAFFAAKRREPGLKKASAKVLTQMWKDLDAGERQLFTAAAKSAVARRSRSRSGSKSKKAKKAGKKGRPAKRRSSSK